MALNGLGRWEPLDLTEVVQLFKDFPARWWISGGHALELHLGRSWRPHDDIDVGVPREDSPRLGHTLRGWDVKIAASGILTPWSGSTPLVQKRQNNLWCRKGSDQPWCIDVTIADGDETHWIFRRDSTVKIPWEEAVLRSEQGVPYLAPELQLLYKSEHYRPKDALDAIEAIPSLDADCRTRLHVLLPEDHPWQALMTG
jgi:hypothetical protein